MTRASGEQSRRGRERTGARWAQARAGDGAGADSMMAGATGLEPATSGVTGRRSNQLSYAPA